MTERTGSGIIVAHLWKFCRFAGPGCASRGWTVRVRVLSVRLPCRWPPRRLLLAGTIIAFRRHAEPGHSGAGPLRERGRASGTGLRGVPPHRGVRRLRCSRTRRRGGAPARHTDLEFSRTARRVQLAGSAAFCGFPWAVHQVRSSTCWCWPRCVLGGASAQDRGGHPVLLNRLDACRSPVACLAGDLTARWRFQRRPCRLHPDCTILAMAGRQPPLSRWIDRKWSGLTYSATRWWRRS